MKPSTRYDWIGLRAEYVVSPATTSLRQFAAAKGIAYSNVANHAAEEGWIDARVEHLQSIAEKRIAIVQSQIAKEEAKQDKEAYDTVSGLAVELRAWLVDVQRKAKDGKRSGKPAQPEKVKAAIDALDRIYRLRRETMGLHPNKAAQRVEVSSPDGSAIIAGVIVLPAPTDE